MRTMEMDRAWIERRAMSSVLTFLGKPMPASSHPCYGSRFLQQHHMSSTIINMLSPSNRSRFSLSICPHGH